MESLDKFAINPTNEFHILRHFEFVDDSYKATLLNKPYWYYDYSQKKYISSYISQDDIEYALETIGTKFDKNITGIENPKKLLELIKEKFTQLILSNKVDWIPENEKGLFAFTFEFDFSVGKMNCLSVGNLSAGDKKNIKPTHRSRCIGESDVVVNTITGIKLQATKMIYVELVETGQLPFFAITSFPDCSANSIPPNDDIVFAL
ncbi:MAG: hypothetical protein KAQ64_01745 [Candidatus Pacebacteria bacterium]|nr:hypothetical protein [Candidatus Paceibacterota bacterium]MCK5591395.1 hypothetical protein [Candidatus Paceibacterota bacterium]